MDILTIAAREGNRAHEAADTNEEKFDAYRQAHQETLKRGRMAEEILGAGGVEQQGEPGWYHVASQSGDYYYVVNLDDRSCSCLDHQQRELVCKHLQAAELYADAESVDPMAPDYEALGRERVTSQYRDSRESAWKVAVQ